ncbi:transcription factor bHLH146-like [Benincasa hispida]|uniref:transcription factor bHLH146-like n=1 Tax=Benincasa hispida TaxID=102211 RepID=UPI001900EAC1|nr:transcription factor bHLH146-like [Benincasa hispida]
MGRQIVRKGSRRVFSLEPNKVAYTMFARNYVKHLMTSLVKISHHHHQHHQQQEQNFQKFVKFEVDMAMAQSASDQFAWGIALKKKLLQRDQVGNENDFDFSLQTVKFSQENLGKEEEEEAEEEKKMEHGLMKLRKIIPGGADFNIEDDDLLKQTESYVKCLELQVNVLRGLVETNTF